jgi:fructose-1-phosphate kinase PfkB-like protein
MPAESPELAAVFFAATRALACHTGSLQERLADTYADHLLQVVAHDLPPDLQPAFRELEACMNSAVDNDDDPFRAATQRLTDAEARTEIERIIALFARLAGLRPPQHT